MRHYLYDIEMNPIQTQTHLKVDEAQTVLSISDFDIRFRNEQKKLFFENGRKKIEVFPFSKNVMGVIVAHLVTNGEMELYAELVGEQIQISAQMKDGTVYKNIMSYTSLASFQKDFPDVE